MTAAELTARILSLAAQGLKPRDIASILHLHPMIVIRTLERHGSA